MLKISADLDGDAVHPPVIEEQRFRAALSLIVTGPHADGIDITPIELVLRVAGGITIDFAGRSLQDSRVAVPRKLEQVQ